MFDEAGAPLGVTTVAADEVGPFLGIVAPQGRTIGRINVSEPGGSELVHAVVAYDADGAANDDAPQQPQSDLLGGLLGGLGL